MKGCSTYTACLLKRECNETENSKIARSDVLWQVTLSKIANKEVKAKGGGEESDLGTSANGTAEKSTSPFVSSSVNPMKKTQPEMSDVN